jgi:hypothetical protein
MGVVAAVVGDLAVVVVVPQEVMRQYVAVYFIECVLNLLLLSYPQINIDPFCIPPSQI